jgi:hypothetical protein
MPAGRSAPATARRGQPAGHTAARGAGHPPQGDGPRPDQSALFHSPGRAASRALTAAARELTPRATAGVMREVGRAAGHSADLMARIRASLASAHEFAARTIARALQAFGLGIPRVVVEVAHLRASLAIPLRSSVAAMAKALEAVCLSIIVPSSGRSASGRRYTRWVSCWRLRSRCVRCNGPTDLSSSPVNRCLHVPDSGPRGSSQRRRNPRDWSPRRPSPRS